MTKVRLSQSSPESVRVDGLIVLARWGSPSGGSPTVMGTALEPDAATALAKTLRPVLGRGTESVAVVPAGADFAAETIAAVTIEDLSPEAVRRAVGAAVRALPRRERVAVLVPNSTAQIVTAATQGALLGAYRYTVYKSRLARDSSGPKSGDSGDLTSLVLLCEGARRSELREAVAEATVVTEAVLAARDLVNAPPSALSPQTMAETIRRQGADTGVRIETYNERKLARAGYGGLTAVGQGSANPPRLVRMEYRPARATTHLALVGKGITFDSGGISLKPPTGMITMKCDMAGAAAVAEATLAIARLELPVHITSYLALAENMPSGTAQRPGDVITIYGGTTVEVLNTDAEGRLVMADALVRAAEDHPDLLIDVATLTGAQTVALGYEIGAAMSNNDDARDQVIDAALASGEALWPMPLPKALRATLDSKIADIANVGDRIGGMLTAGLFLSDFVDADLPWVHLDIAGPAFNEGPARDYTPPGGTGSMVRTLVTLAQRLATPEQSAGDGEAGASGERKRAGTRSGRRARSGGSTRKRTS